MSQRSETGAPEAARARRLVLPLALGQFIASYGCSNMNVAINNIAHDLGTTVIGVQTAITLFTLTMSALMMAGSKLTDSWGRKRCFIAGLAVYAIGGVVAALSTSVALLIVGYSLLEGIGSALLIPPIYILVTVSFTDLATRAKYFGVVSASAGIGSAAGPLIGGLITSTTSWRVSFLAQVVAMVWIIYLSRRIVDRVERAPEETFDLAGAVLSGLGLVLIVLGTLTASRYGWFRARENVTVAGTVVIHEGGIAPVWPLVAAGLLVLVWFVVHIRNREQRGRTPLLSPVILRNHVSNRGLVTQNVQWLTLQGSFFVVSVFLQTIRGFSAIATGLVLTPATAGILVASGMARRLADRHPQARLIQGGFVATIVGLLLLLGIVRSDSNILTFVPGLLLSGLGIGVMLTSSVNVVQSEFEDARQAEISGLSRAVSNLGSSFGTSIAGSVLVSSLAVGNKTFALALVTMAVIALVGLVAAFLLPVERQKAAGAEQALSR